MIWNLAQVKRKIQENMNLVTGKGLIKVETEETRRLFHWYLELKFELLNDTYYSKNNINIRTPLYNIKSLYDLIKLILTGILGSRRIKTPILLDFVFIIVAATWFSAFGSMPSKTDRPDDFNKFTAEKEKSYCESKY